MSRNWKTRWASRALYNLAEVAQERSERVRALRLGVAAERLMEQVKSPLAHLASELLQAVMSVPGVEITEENTPDALRRAAALHSLETLIAWAISD